MLGKAPYPAVEDVLAEIKSAKGKVTHIRPEERPEYEGQPVPENVYVLGAACRNSALGNFICVDEIRTTIENKWKKGIERNLFTFEAGYKLQV
jgi:hypothetical protein